jgi:ATP-dependent helicase HrpA
MNKLLQTLSTLCQDVMRCDQVQLQQRIRALQKNPKTEINPALIAKLTAAVEKSLQRRQQRLQHLPKPTFPDDLPISERRAEIADLIQKHQVVIIAGETGSGKTTQLPKICLELGRGVAGFIGCTQPRRIAARTVAQRVANELNIPLGQAVGYKIRFSDQISHDSHVKFMTDGILLAETQSDRYLNQYDTLIIDEAHERSLNIDFLLGYLKRLLPKRPDLKVIITSATIDTQRFSEHFDHAPIIEVTGRMYPVEVRYRPLESHGEDEQDRDLQQAIVDAVDEISAHERHGDILIFLSGERDIRETTESLHKHSLPHTEIIPLYARLSASEQNRAFQTSKNRRIILATNVAETSLTVPNIKAVIDTGLARISRYSVRSKVQRLPIEKISRSSADQRKGRCGRIAAGLCIRLYSEDDFLSRAEFTPPEVLRTSLAAVILQMLSLNLGDIGDFPFIEPPTPKMINDGFTLLHELGAVTAKRDLTEIGQQLAKLPIDPRIGRMILAAREQQCLHEVLIIASALSIQDPRERPLDAQGAADAAQQKFLDEQSDFLSYLKLWDFLQSNAQHLSKNKLRKLCHDNFLSYLRMLEWEDVHHQLLVLVKEAGWQINQIPAEYDALHRALLSGLLGNLATKSDNEQYNGARGLKLHIFPASGLFKKQPKWMMAAELVETSRLYARGIAKINPEWVEAIAGNLCQHSYFEPHWEKRVAEVAAFERVSLYGLTLVAKRKVNYGAIDPVLSREIFIRNALVEGDFHCNAPFFKHNQELTQDVERLEHKARRQDILVDPEQVYQFYAARIPEGIYSGRSFEQWRKTAERKNPKCLFLTREDLMQHAGEHITHNAFPDHLTVLGVDLALSYHFEPNHPNDGVTVSVPIALLNQLKPAPFEWLVRGLLEEKIIAFLRNLPKSLRKHFVPIPDVAKRIFESFDEPPEGSLSAALGLYVQRYLGEPVAPELWDETQLDPHLLMNFQLLDLEDQILDMGRDLRQLQAKWGDFASRSCQQQVTIQSSWQKSGAKTWDFSELPRQIDLTINGVNVQGFPTLVDCETHVDLQVFDNPQQAASEFKRGLSRLFWLNLPTKSLLKQLALDHKACLQYMKFGTCESLRADILQAAIQTLFLPEPLPNDQSSFNQRLSEGKQKLYNLLVQYTQVVAAAMSEYAKINEHLCQQLPLYRKALPDIEQQVQGLIYPQFVQNTPFSQLQHIPRYLKAIELRLQKLLRDPQKDMLKLGQFVPLWEAYQKLLVKKPDSTVLPEIRWMLEELRVSLFAQELRTPYAVSVQRVQKLLDSVK